jgi:hypothetical protein
MGVLPSFQTQSAISAGAAALRSGTARPAQLVDGGFLTR